MSGRVGSGRVGSGRVLWCSKYHGRVELGQEFFEYHKSGRVTLARSDDPRKVVGRFVESPAVFEANFVFLGDFGERANKRRAMRLWNDLDKVFLRRLFLLCVCGPLVRERNRF